MTQAIALKKPLYESDYLLWTQDIIAKLQARDFDGIDIDNLIEEIEDLGRSAKRELKQRLATLLEHLLKRLYVNMPQEYNGWERTIREQRRQIKRELKEIPSLKTIWNESFDIEWEFVLDKVRDDYAQFVFPDQWQFDRDTDTILNVDFWQ